MGNGNRPTPEFCPPEFRREAVRLALTSGRTRREIAEDLGVTSRVIIRLLREQLGPFAMPVLQCIGGRSAFEH